MENILYKLKNLLPKKVFKLLQPPYHFILGFLAALRYGFPSRKIIVIGITGTTGKTSTTLLLAKTLQSAGFKVGYTSTAMFGDGKKEWLNDKKMTMVGRGFTQRLLKEMVKNGCQYAIVETTSEGVRQFRHRFINYDLLIFTGLYPEHIESHGSFEKYRQAKGKLFRHLKYCSSKYINDDKKVCKPAEGLNKLNFKRVKKTIIVNGEDKEASYFLNFWSEEKIICLEQTEELNSLVQAWQGKAEFIKYNAISASAKGTSFSLFLDNNQEGSIIPQKERIKTQLLGVFSVANAVSAIAVSHNQGLTIETIKNSLETVNGLPGRLEKIDEGQNFTVIVDYAFEPNALNKLFDTVEMLLENQAASHPELVDRHIIQVLGAAGGGRDTWRRPEIGKISGARASFVIITNEDPYDDDPQVIIEQVAAGAEYSGKQVEENLFKILDRREAIRFAFSLAREGDIVLITGKGSEQAICLAQGEKIPWDDRQVAREELKNVLQNN